MIRAIVLLAAMLQRTPAFAHPQPVLDCDAARLTAAGAYAHDLLTCHARAARRGNSAPTVCAGKARRTFVAAWDRIDPSSMCSVALPGIAPTSESVARWVEYLARSMASALSTETRRSVCASRQMRLLRDVIEQEIAAKVALHTDLPHFATELANAAQVRAGVPTHVAIAERPDDCEAPVDSAFFVETAIGFADGLEEQILGCNLASATEFFAIGSTLWPEVLSHVRSLGFDEVVEARTCPVLLATAPDDAPPIGTTRPLLNVTAMLRNGATHAVIHFVYVASLGEAMLVRRDHDGHVTLFNDVGGVRISSTGAVTSVDATGFPQSIASQHRDAAAASRTACGDAFLDRLACLQSYCVAHGESCALASTACAVTSVFTPAATLCIARVVDGLLDAQPSSCRPPSAAACTLSALSARCAAQGICDDRTGRCVGAAFLAGVEHAACDGGDATTPDATHPFCPSIHARRSAFLYDLRCRSAGNAIGCFTTREECDGDACVGGPGSAQCAVATCRDHCCPGRDDACTPEGAICNCDEYCRVVDDCCPDVGEACGF